MRIEKRISENLMEYAVAVIWCLKLSWKTSPLYTILRMVSSMGIPILSVIITYIGKDVINLLGKASNDKRDLNMLLFLFFALFTVTILDKGLHALTQYCQIIHGELLDCEISLMIMDRSLNCDLEYFDNPLFNDKLTLANQDSYVITNILWNVIASFGAFVSFVCVFCVICKENPAYCIILFVSTIPSAFVSAKYTRFVYKLSVDQISAKRQMGYVQSIASDKHYAQEIRLFEIGKWLKQRYCSIWKKLFEERKEINRKRALLIGFFECLPEVVIAFISIDIALKILSGIAKIGDYIFYTGLIAQLWGAAYTLISSTMEVYGNRLKIDNIKALNQFENKIENGNLKLNEIDSIVFDKVCFTYPGVSRPTLKDVSITFNKEEKVALVGANGSGKTTFVKLLLRMYEPDSGRIFINGINIKKYRISELRANFSVYFQEMLNYGFTVRENFEVSDFGIEAMDDAIERALEAASFGDLLEYSSKRCDASLMRFFDPEGIELSGGQFQKLALARTFYRKRSVLIFDEPSSSLDLKAEEKINNSIKILSDKKLLIIISHHLSNISLANKIVVFKDGEVVEEGGHTALLNNNSYYADIFRSNRTS